MRGRFITGITAGTLIGVAAGMIMSPQVDRSTRRRIRRSGRYMRDMAEDVYDGMVHILK